MTLKLAFGDMKKQFKNYLVLFSGLLIAAAIFYIFQALATNQAFFRSVVMMKFQTLVRIANLGTFLLALISIIYLFNANSFLLVMRQRIYAMYLILGAKSQKIAELIFGETLFIGLIAVFSGIMIGILLAEIAGKALISQMDLNVPFTAINWRAALITLLFFVIIFLLLAIYNALKLTHTPILKLLNQAQTPTRNKKNKIIEIIEAILSLGLLATGYYALMRINDWKINSLVIALFTIIAGTYGVFDSLFLGLVQLLQHHDQFRFTKLHSFTLGQLSFRLRDCSRLLTLVSLLFALALGAISVGNGFKKQINVLTQTSTYYDLVLHDPSNQTLKQVQKIGIKTQTVYQYKVRNKINYFPESSLNRQPFYNNYWDSSNTIRVKKYTKANLNQDFDLRGIFWLYFPKPTNKLKMVNQQKYTKIRQKPKNIYLFTFKNLEDNYKKLKPFVLQESRSHPFINSSIQKYENYVRFKQLFSSLTFLGLFLGIAFLAMLASCLMFRILMNATRDVQRYHRLAQVGARRRTLKNSLMQEIAAVFTFPALVGIVHVLFGLQMFEKTKILLHPYHNITISVIFFVLLYSVYYGLTGLLYAKIVLVHPK